MSYFSFSSNYLIFNPHTPLLYQVEISKSDVDLDLDDLEKAAKIVEMEEEIEKKKKLMNGQNSSSQKVIKEQELCKDIATLSLSNKR